MVEAMLPFLKEQFGNPLSLHCYGDGPRQPVEQAREKVAELIGARGNEIYLAASGNEANNMAAKGVALMNRAGGASRPPSSHATGRTPRIRRLLLLV